MPSGIGSYDHINEESKLEVALNIEEVAQKIHDLNYGDHRLLSAMVRIRRNDRGKCTSDNALMLTNGIEELLNKGGY